MVNRTNIQIIKTKLSTSLFLFGFRKRNQNANMVYFSKKSISQADQIKKQESIRYTNDPFLGEVGFCKSNFFKFLITVIQ